MTDVEYSLRAKLRALLSTDHSDAPPPCSTKCLLSAPLTPQNVVSLTAYAFVLLTAQKAVPDLLNETAAFIWQILLFGSRTSL